MHGSHVLSSRHTTSGAVTSQRGKVHGIYYVASGTAGTIVLKNGGASGTAQLEISTPALATWAGYVPIPGEGMLFRSDIYVDVSNASSVTVLYTT